MNRDEYLLWGAAATCRRGEQLHHAKLTEDAVRAIRANRQGKTAKQLAADYGVHWRTIQQVIYRQTWVHVV